MKFMLSHKKTTDNMRVEIKNTKLTIYLSILLHCELTLDSNQKEAKNQY